MTYSRRTWVNGNQWDAVAANDFEGRIETEFGVKATEIGARALQTSLNTTNSNLTALDTRETTDVAALDARLDAIEGITAVTSLPGSPTDGQQVYYIADSTSGVIWHLRYRSGSASSFKWEFVGGSWLNSTQLSAASVSGTGSAYGDLVSSNGPDITAPLAGDYDCELMAVGRSSSTQFTVVVNIGAGVSIGVGAQPSVTGLDATIGGNGYAHLQGFGLLTGVTASATLRMRYLYASVSNLTYENRYFRVRPVRVG